MTLNRKILFTFCLLLATSYLLFGQNKKDDIILLPGQGIVIYKDTILLGKTPEFIISKLDTINNSFDIVYGDGTSDVVTTFYDSDKNKVRSVDTFLMFKSCQITYKNNLRFKFIGSTKDSVFLTNITIDYPLSARTLDNLQIGSDKESIFKNLPKIEGSYNCGHRGWFFCYPDKGISFQVKPYKEKPDIEMFDKIIGVEIYNGRRK